MATYPVDMNDVTRPDGVEGRMVDEQRVYDKDSDTYPISEVVVWLDYKISDQVIESARKLTLSPGLIGAAVDKAYDVALATEVAAQKAAHPEYTDEEALAAAQAEVTRANAQGIWTQLRSAVNDISVQVASVKAEHPEYSAEQLSYQARVALADYIAQSLYAKDTGAQSWGLRLLKYAWNGKGIS